MQSRFLPEPLWLCSPNHTAGSQKYWHALQQERYPTLPRGSECLRRSSWCGQSHPISIAALHRQLRYNQPQYSSTRGFHWSSQTTKHRLFHNSGLKHQGWAETNQGMCCWNENSQLNGKGICHSEQYQAFSFFFTFTETSFVSGLTRKEIWCVLKYSILAFVAGDNDFFLTENFAVRLCSGGLV